jgi:hypothetical protein
MRSTILTIFLAIAMAVAVTLVSVNTVMARGCEVSVVDSLFSIDKTAPGTKISGPLTISYEFLGEGVDGCEISTNMQAFLRVRKGADYDGYSMAPVHVCYENISKQQGLLDNFIRDTVIPRAFPDSPTALYALKSVDLVIDGGDGDTEPLFTIMDVVIAVQD